MYLNIEHHLTAKLEVETDGAHNGSIDPDKLKQNKKALAFVKGALSDKLFKRYNHTVCNELWANLLKDYQELDAQQLFVLRNKYIYCVKTPNQKMSDYICHLDELHSQIKNAGYEISNTDCILTILNGTHNEFSDFVSSVTGKQKVNELKLDELKEKLIREDQYRRSMIEKSSPRPDERRVFYTDSKVENRKHFNKPRYKRRDKNSKDNRRCYSCNQVGHYANECPKKSNLKSLVKKVAPPKEFTGCLIDKINTVLVT